jgi:hypothetical protein
MEIGNTYVLQNKSIDEHLWIVISHPEQEAEQIVIVSLTSYGRLRDASCILGRGDHPWIRHQTVVGYEFAKCVKESDIDLLVASGELIPREDASDDLLRKILLGAERTDAMPTKCQRVLEDQGLIEL